MKEEKIDGSLFIFMDSDYFDYEVYEGNTFSLDRAAYQLATYLFDRDGDPRYRKKIKQCFPRKVYVKALEYYIDENHDT